MEVVHAFFSFLPLRERKVLPAEARGGGEGEEGWHSTCAQAMVVWWGWGKTQSGEKGEGGEMKGSFLGWGWEE